MSKISGNSLQAWRILLQLRQIAFDNLWRFMLLQNIRDVDALDSLY